MQFNQLSLDGVVLIEAPIYGDARGSFCETWRVDAFERAGITTNWVQDNQSRSTDKGTIRGLHWQVPPSAQAKLVRVLHGAILDVVVDLRAGSSSFGQWLGVELAGDKNQSLFVPVGFAHGFCTLMPDTIVAYKTSAPYAPNCERALAWNCPDLAIDWPLHGRAPILSDKDGAAPKLQNLTKGDLF